EKYFLLANGQQDHREVFGPGETFGAISILLNNQKAIRSVRTLEQSVIYHLPEIYFQELCQKYEGFYEFFTQEFGKRMLQGGYTAHLSRNPETKTSFQSSDLAFTRQVREQVSSQLNTCSPDTSIREAARSMTYYRRSYVLITDENQQPQGIVTDLDLRNKVVSEGRNVEEPVSRIMSSPVFEIHAEAFVYEAILEMFRRKVQHLAVRDKGVFTGIVTLEKLLDSQSKSPFLFIQSISHEYTQEGLHMKWSQAPGIVGNLLERGVRPEIITPIVSTLADAITGNIIRRAIKDLGAPPVRFAFLSLGSEGRREQTLSTDQDNALVWEDVPEHEEDAAAEYFHQLGVRISDELNEVGFVYCKGGLMAQNPLWNRPVSQWKQQFETWTDNPTQEHVMTASAFFDSRVIYGDASLWEDVQGYASDLLRNSSHSFLLQLSRASLVNKPPLTFFGGFQLVEQEDRKGVNLKKAMSIISDFARIYALNHRISAINTEDRLDQLLGLGVLSEGEYKELHQSFFFMMR
ncbi:MAG: CBS domain-containing protein, partial [Bacteroidetes bacterium]